MQPGIHSYAPIPSTQSYYPPTTGVPQPVMPKQEDYGAYNQNYPSHGSALPERTSSHSQSNPASYSFRPPLASGLMPRPNGTLESPSQGVELKPLMDGNTNWSRSGTSNNLYAPTPSPSSNPHPSYPASTSQWSVMPPVNQALPRPEGAWVGGSESSSSQWTMQNSILPRHNSYHATPQSN